MTLVLFPQRSAAHEESPFLSFTGSSVHHSFSVTFSSPGCRFFPSDGNNINLSPNPIHGKIKGTVLSMMWRKFIIDAEDLVRKPGTPAGVTVPT